MRRLRLLAVAALGVAFVAWAASIRALNEDGTANGLQAGTPIVLQSATCTAGTCFRVPPVGLDAGVGEGLPLKDVTGLRVSVCAPVGSVLVGGGKLLAEAWVDTMGTWNADPQLNQAISVTATSCLKNDGTTTYCQCQTFPDIQQVATIPGNRVLFVASGVTVQLLDGGVTPDGTVLRVLTEGAVNGN